MTVLETLKRNIPLQAVIVGIAITLFALLVHEIYISTLECWRYPQGGTCSLSVIGIPLQPRRDIWLGTLREARTRTETGEYRSNGSTSTSFCYRAELVTFAEETIPLTNCELSLREASVIAAPVNAFLQDGSAQQFRVTYNVISTARFAIWFAGGTLTTAVGVILLVRQHKPRRV